MPATPRSDDSSGKDVVRSRGRWRSLLVVGLVLATVVGIGRPIVDLPLRVGRNHNEGWNAHQATLAMQGEALYPAAAEPRANNYPPLSFYVVGAIGELTGDPLRSGRAVSLVSLAVVAIVSGWIVAWVTGASTMGWIASLLLLATMGTHFQNYVAMNDPQLLGHAFQYLGLAAVLRWGSGRRALAACAVLVVAGGLVKHNLIAVPLALTIWMVRHHRDRLRFWLFFSIGAVVLTTLGLFALFGEALFAGVLGHARSAALHLPPWALQRWILPISPLFVVSLGALLLPDRRGILRLLAWVGGLGLVSGLLMSFGEGVNYNVVFDAVFAAAMLGTIAAHGLARSVDSGPEVAARPPVLRWMEPGLLLLVSAPVLVMIPIRALDLSESIETWSQRAAAAEEDLAFIDENPGPVLVEDPALSHWSGRSLAVDFFNYAQKRNAGRLDDDSLEAKVQERRFSVVQLDRREGSPRLGDAVNSALRANYELVRHSPVNGWLFRPRRTPASDGG